jgi:hypothetical protein
MLKRLLKALPLGVLVSITGLVISFFQFTRAFEAVFPLSPREGLVHFRAI